MKLTREHIGTLMQASTQEESGSVLPTATEADVEHCVVQLRCGISGPFDVQALRRAWCYVLCHHRELRTAPQSMTRTEHEQAKPPVERLVWALHDLRRMSHPAQLEQMRTLAQTDRERIGGQSRHAPMCVSIARLARNTYAVVYTTPAGMLSAAQCLSLFRQVWSVYPAISRRQRPFASRIRPQRVSGQGAVQQTRPGRDESFWRQELTGFTAPTPVGIERCCLRCTEVTGTGEQEIRLSRTATAALDSFLRKHNLTLDTVLCGAWALLLSRYSREDDVIFGTNACCRIRAAAPSDAVAGACASTLPLRVHISPDASVLTWLRDLRSRCERGSEFAACSLDEVRGWSDMTPGLRLFDSVMLVEAPAREIRCGRAVVQDMAVFPYSAYPLTIVVLPGPKLSVTMVYARERFDEPAVARMLGHLKTLIEGMSSDPAQRIAQVPMLTRVERQQILLDWNDTRSPVPSDDSVHHLFEAQVARNPHATALVGADQSLTYEELNARANQIAHYLRRQLHVGPGMLVGLYLDRSIELFSGLLGILKAGAAYVPLDPTYPAERISYMLEDSRASVLLTQQRFAAQLPAHDATVICLDSQWDSIAREGIDNPARCTGSRDLAYVIYTSGSTGSPKGVLIPHSALLNHNLAMAQWFELRRSDRALQFASISFDAAAEEIFPTWLSGASLVLRPDDVSSSFRALRQFLERQQITVVNLPTAYWHEWTTELARSDSSVPSSVRLVVVGGEKALPEQLNLWKQVAKSDVRWLNTYGPTETTITATVYEPPATDEGSNDEGSNTAPIPIGRPIANTTAYVLDRHLQPVPVGVPGELLIGGAGLAASYLHRPDLTAEKFITNPYGASTEERLYRTGDLTCYRPDGMLEYLGRIDHQVKIRGFRIELGEIEAALTQHTAVQEAVVLAREDESGGKRLVAYVLSAASAAPTSSELHELLKNKLPQYMLPSAYVVLRSWPMTPNGKVDRRALPPPPSSRGGANAAFVPPRITLHHQLAEIWEEVLGVPSLGIQDNFFDLGGHSLLAARLVDEIERICGRRIALPTFFVKPTIEHLTEMILAADEADASSMLVAVKTGGSKRPFFFLHGDLRGGGFYCWTMARLLGSDQPFYVLQPYGLDDGHVPDSVGTMAATYLERVRAIQPHGPYQLGGFCNGGLLAFEMAQQLTAQGETVDLLFMVDPATVRTRQRVLRSLLALVGKITGSGPDAQFAWYMYIRGFRHQVRPRQIMAAAQVHIQRVRWMIRRYSAWVRRDGDVGDYLAQRITAQPSDAAPAQSRDTNRAQIWAAYDWALFGYEPHRFPGTVTLVWSRDSYADEPGDPIAWWKGLARDANVHMVPGTHNTSVTRHVDVLAAQLAAGLGQSERTLVGELV